MIPALLPEGDPSSLTAYLYEHQEISLKWFSTSPMVSGIMKCGSRPSTANPP